jgi:hypothetical protein
VNIEIDLEAIAIDLNTLSVNRVLITGSQQPHFKTRHCLLGAAATCFLIGVVSMTFSRLKVEVYLICSAQLVDAEEEILGYISI